MRRSVVKASATAGKADASNPASPATQKERRREPNRRSLMGTTAGVVVDQGGLLDLAKEREGGQPQHREGKRIAPGLRGDVGDRHHELADTGAEAPGGGVEPDREGAVAGAYPFCQQDHRQRADRSGGDAGHTLSGGEPGSARREGGGGRCTRHRQEGGQERSAPTGSVAPPREPHRPERCQPGDGQHQTHLTLGQPEPRAGERYERRQG
jgi:hypothetical protein